MFQGVSRPGLDALARALGARSLPIFNTGVMIFNRGSHRRIGAATADLLDLGARFHAGDLELPCFNRGITEEVCASLVLGRLEPLRWGYLDRADAPFYLEWRARLVGGCGLVMHTWSHYLPFAVVEFFGRDAVKHAPDPKIRRMTVAARR